MYKNKYFYRTFAVLCIAGWFTGGASGVMASDNSVTVLPAEGNVVCDDYASNKIILSMDAKALESASGEITGPENPADPDMEGESVAYALSDGATRLSFSNSTTPIDYAVLKSGGDVSIAIYESGGVTDDANLTVTVDEVDKRITAFSLCYGLGNEAPPPPPPLVTKSCNLDAVLDATGIQCPADGSRTLVCNLELDDPLYGAADGSDTCCVCNADALPECDANAAAGEPNACTIPKGTVDPTLPASEVTTRIEINNDPYYCLTVGGTRTCYKY